jgi:hypothetical protein
MYFSSQIINKFNYNKNDETESVEKLYDSCCGLRPSGGGGAWRLATLLSFLKQIFLSITINL